MESLFGWLIFLAVLAWFYRLPPWMWSTHLHYGDDAIEAVWQANFWRDAVLSGDFNLVSREMAYPVGMHQFIEAHSGPGLLLLPFSLAFGGIAAVNVGFVGGFILCFIGARRFLRFFTDSPFIASCHRYFQAWVKAGVFIQILNVLAEDLYARGRIDLSECFAL